jgi:hypothetical protein
MKYALAAIVAALIPATAGADTIENVKMPDKTAPFSSWTAVQQWMPFLGHAGNARSDYGYGNEAGYLVLADELGDKLSALGRASFVDLCFRNIEEGSKSALVWALCGDDVGKVDLAKADAELTAAKITDKAEVIAKIKQAVDNAKKIGASVEAAAKTDPGIQSVLKLAADARTEWAAYASKNGDAIARYLALKDGVRSGKSNNPAFTGCDEATRPAFQKLVKATKFPQDVGGDPMLSYLGYLTKTTEGYIVTVAYAACAWAYEKAGESIYVGAANQGGGGARAGWRSLALAKAMDGNFTPKFAERSLSWDDMKSHWKYGIQMTGVEWRYSIMTPTRGAVAALKKKDDTNSTVTFKGNTVDACLQWNDSKKIVGFRPDGTVQYDKVCAKRGNIPNQTTPIDVPTRYATGIGPGVSMVAVLQFPVAVWKGNQYVSILGVPAK